MPAQQPRSPQLTAFDFSQEVRRLTEQFTGRRWLFEQIDAWVHDGDQRFFLLTGEPGIGKSAIAARLLQLRDDLIAHHFCIAGRNSTITPGAVLRSLSAQFGRALPGYGVALANTVGPEFLAVDVSIDVQRMTGGEITGVVIENLFAPEPQDVLDILLRAPLTAMAPPAEQPLLILIDSLDEAVTYRGEDNLVRLLAGAKDLPAWLRFLCTSRPERRVLRYFENIPSRQLALESGANREDVHRYVAARVKGEPLAGRLAAAARTMTGDFVDRVTHLADGNFLYARVLLDDVAAGNQPLDDLTALPASLDDIYHRFLTRFTAAEWEARYQPLFTVLAVAAEPLTEQQLAHFTGLRRTGVRHSLNVGRQFLDATEGDGPREAFTLFHQSLRDYLIDEERNQDFWCAPEDGHERVAAFYLQRHQASWSACDRYGLRHVPLHLRQSGQTDTLRQLLLDYSWLQAKLAATDATDLLADFDLLEQRAEPLQLLYEALRLSAHVLAQDPAQLPSQLWGRLGERPETALSTILTTAAATQEGLWLRPLRPTLEPPGGPLLRTMERHSDLFLSVAVTPDGRHALSASYDGTLKVWDLESGRELQTLAGHGDQVTGVVTTPDGRRAVSSSEDGTLKVWDLQSGRELRTLAGHGDWVAAVAVAPDGRRAVSASGDKTLKVWDLQSGRELRTLAGHTTFVDGVAVLPDGRRAVSASGDATLKVWDLESGREVRTLKGHGGIVTAVAVTPDGRGAISTSYDGTLKVWDLESGRELRTLAGHEDWVAAVAVTPDGRRAVSASGDAKLKVWDLESGRELRTLAGHADQVMAVALTPDGRRAVSASDDSTLKVWNLEGGRALRAPEGHDDTVTAVSVTRDGRRAVSASSVGTLKVWDLESARVLRSMEGHTAWVEAIAVAADGRRAVSASGDKTLKVWDLESGRELRTLQGHSRVVIDVALTPDGRHAVSASQDTTLKVWDLESGRELRTLKGHGANVVAVAVTPDGRRAVSASDDTTLKIWDLKSGRELHNLVAHTRPVTAVAVTPGGRRAVSASGDKTLKVWDLESGREIHTLKEHGSVVSAVAITPDGRHAVSASSDRIVKVWGLESGHELCTLAGHGDSVDVVAVTPDGRLAVSASWDKSLKVWKLESGEQVAGFTGDSAMYACAIAPDGRTFVAGGTSGRVHFLRLEGIDPRES